MANEELARLRGDLKGLEITIANMRTQLDQHLGARQYVVQRIQAIESQAVKEGDAQDGETESAPEASAAD